MNSYEYWTNFAATWGSIYFAAMFAVAMVYALRPKNKAVFDTAARLPLDEED